MHDECKKCKHRTREKEDYLYGCSSAIKPDCNMARGFKDFEPIVPEKCHECKYLDEKFIERIGDGKVDDDNKYGCERRFKDGFKCVPHISDWNFFEPKSSPEPIRNKNGEYLDINGNPCLKEYVGKKPRDCKNCKHEKPDSKTCNGRMKDSPTLYHNQYPHNGKSGNFAKCRFEPKESEPIKKKRDCKNCKFERPNKHVCYSHTIHEISRLQAGVAGGMTDYNPCEFEPKVPDCIGFGNLKSWIPINKKPKIITKPQINVPIVGEEEEEMKELRADTICQDCKHFYDIKIKKYTGDSVHYVCPEGMFVDIVDGNTVEGIGICQKRKVNDGYKEKEEEKMNLDPIKEIEKRIDDIVKERRDLAIKIDDLRDYDFLIYLKKGKFLSKKEYKIINNVRKYYIRHEWKSNEYYEDMDADTWQKHKTLFDKYLRLVEEKFVIYKKLELCKLTDCYKDMTQTKRKKIALKICDKCGKETPVEAKFCAECGVSF